MNRVSESLHHYLKCCCCKLDISYHTVKIEIFKNIYYSVLFVLLLVYNIYYFNYNDLLMENVTLLVAIFTLISISLIILYVINMIYLVFIIVKNREFINSPRIVPLAEVEESNNITNTSNESNLQNIQVAVLVNN